MCRLIKRRLRVSLSAMVMEHPQTIALTIRLGSEGVNMAVLRQDMLRRMKHHYTYLYQYSFVKQGIPSIFPDVGNKSSDPNIKPDEITRRWFTTIYHTPQDDMTQTFNFESGAKFAAYSFLVGYLVAQL